jgi:hypothetical protein
LQGIVHVDIEAMTDVKGLQVRAVVKDGCQSYIGEITAEELKSAQPMHRCNPQGIIIFVLQIIIIIVIITPSSEYSLFPKLMKR